jgi:hypothetical protein
MMRTTPTPTRRIELKCKSRKEETSVVEIEQGTAWARKESFTCFRNRRGLHSEAVERDLNESSNVKHVLSLRDEGRPRINRRR